jgi:predicted phosphodiesterase
MAMLAATPMFIRFTALILLCSHARAHPGGPEARLAYDFTRAAIVAGEKPVLKPRFGPSLELSALPLDEDFAGKGLRFAGVKQAHRLAATPEDLAKLLPAREFTVAAWISIDEPQRFGAVFSALEDNGGKEAGLALGYNESRPYVALATKGGDDGDGRMTYLTSPKPWKKGQVHQLVATYDGAALTLYLDGEAVAETKDQSGEILWPQGVQAWLGGYRDSDENYPHAGRLIDFRLYDVCANPEWVKHDLEHHDELMRMPLDSPPPVEPAIVVQPYLQWITETEATVRWETNFPCRGIVSWGEGFACGNEVEESEARTFHEVKLTGLEPEMLYYYRTASPAGGERVLAAYHGTRLETEVATLQTANRPDTPFGFVVLSDTQRQDQVANTLAKAAWDLRPNFAVIAGDLVDAGNSKWQWEKQFFPALQPLISRVPFYPVLGNHEVNTQYYYDYMSLPAPEYFYTFRYGNTQFFMLDTNRDVRPGTEQFQWLERELAASTARWKVCVHHQPPFSSDDDYGNDWKTPLKRATLGDEKSKPLVELYDRHAVDIVWCGHIHSYERTWLIRGGKPVEKDGTLYMITGGGGGPLERPGPYRPGFQRHVKQGHHFCYVTVHGGEFDIKAYDLEGRLFDQVTLRKAADR